VFKYCTAKKKRKRKGGESRGGGDRAGGSDAGRKEGRKEGKSELQLFPSLMPLATSGPLCPSASSIQLNVLMDLSRKRVDRRQRQQLR
jgi:hypothetical protein